MHLCSGCQEAGYVGGTEDFSTIPEEFQIPAEKMTYFHCNLLQNFLLDFMLDKEIDTCRHTHILTCIQGKIFFQGFRYILSFCLSGLNLSCSLSLPYVSYDI